MSEGEGERDSYFYNLQFSRFLPFDICTSFAFDIFIFRHFYFRHFYFRPKFRESKEAHLFNVTVNKFYMHQNLKEAKCQW
jgi:hypothetical protein